MNANSLLEAPSFRVGRPQFTGPNAVLTNDKYPPGKNLRAPKIGDNVSVGANSTLLPGICIGEGALIAAGSVVTRDVPDHMMAIGVPARVKKLPEMMKREH